MEAVESETSSTRRLLLACRRRATSARTRTAPNRKLHPLQRHEFLLDSLLAFSSFRRLGKTRFRCRLSTTQLFLSSGTPARSFAGSLRFRTSTRHGLGNGNRRTPHHIPRHISPTDEILPRHLRAQWRQKLCRNGLLRRRRHPDSTFKIHQPRTPPALRPSCPLGAAPSATRKHFRKVVL